MIRIYKLQRIHFDWLIVMTYSLGLITDIVNNVNKKRTGKWDTLKIDGNIRFLIKVKLTEVCMAL